MKKVECAVRRTTSSHRDQFHHFFGYYDKCPWDGKDNRILTHRTTFIDRFPNPNDRAEIGYTCPTGRNEFVKIADTTAWNWQQGAQLQWLPNGLSDTEQIIFNDRQGGQMITVVLDPASGRKRMINAPIYTVSPRGQRALSLNYARLFDMRMDYGIPELKDTWRNVMCPEDDGICSVDLQTGAIDLIVSIAQGAAVNRCPLGEGAKHWVNHMMFNPSGSRFCFLHRFQHDDRMLHSRLLTADVDGSGLRLLFDGMVSHYCWKDETTILAWAGKRKILGRSSSRSSSLMTAAKRCLKPIYYAMGKPRILMQKVMGDSYYLIQDAPNGTAERFAYGRLTTDGHCTLSPDGRWMLADGYTDAKNCLPLLLCNMTTQEVIEIGRFPTPKALDGPVRVDLHPRFNRDGTKVCIDSAMDGTRQMYVVDISEIVGAA